MMSDTTDDRPLVTFAVIAYNQERYIREAIEGAFAQTYQPLEIILSDDASSDRTYDIMQEMAAAYEGPHRVVLNRNARNLTLVPHVNKLITLFNGQLIVLSAGDDVSMRHRVATIVEAWAAERQTPYLLHSNAIKINETGDSDGVVSYPPTEVQRHELNLVRIIEKQVNCIGATAAWDRRLIEAFGEIPEAALIEDRTMFLRAALLKRAKYIAESLVFHRSGGVSHSTQKPKDHQLLPGSRMYVLPLQRIRFLSWQIGAMKAFLSDLENYAPANKKELIDTATCVMKNAEPHVIYSQKPAFRLLILLPYAIRSSIQTGSARHLKTCVKYIIFNSAIGKRCGKT